MSYPGYPNNNSAYPPYPSSGGFPQPTPNSGYPPYGAAGNAPGYNPPPTVGFNVGAYPPSPAGGANYPVPPSAGGYPPMQGQSTGGYPPGPPSSNYPPGAHYPPGPPSDSYPPGPPSSNYPPSGSYPPGASFGGGYPPSQPGHQSTGGYPPQPAHGGGGYPPGPTVGAYGQPSAGYPPPSGFPGQYPPVGAPNPAHYNVMPDAVHGGHNPSAPSNDAAAAAAVGLAIASAQREIKEEIRDEKLEELEEAIKKLTGKMEKQEDKLEDKKEELEDRKEELEDKKDNKEEHKKHIEERKTEGTIKEHHPFEPKEDAAALKKAMKGLGTNEKVIIDILATRTNEQRQKIAHEYKNSSGKELMKNLKSELGGHFEDAVLALMTPREKYLAECLHGAVAGSGTNERILVEILCTATNEEIHKIKAFYSEVYGKQLEKDIAGDTSGYFKALLVAIVLGNRDDSREVDEDEAEKDAKVIFEAGLKKMAAAESAFTKMIVSKSYAQLRATFVEFEKLYKDSIESALKKELSGDVLNPILALVSCIKHKEKYFAEQLQNAMKGLGTKDKTLIRIIVSRSEIDLKEIKEEYHKVYGKALEAVVKSEAAGDYRKVLLAIIK